MALKLPLHGNGDVAQGRLGRCNDTWSGWSSCRAIKALITAQFGTDASLAGATGLGAARVLVGHGGICWHWQVAHPRPRLHRPAAPQGKVLALAIGSFIGSRRFLRYGVTESDKDVRGRYEGERCVTESAV